MTTTRERCIQALTEISSHPTAPFHEYRMAEYILSELARLGLPVRRDEYGNIIAEYVGPNAPEQGIAIVSHMDHPGIELANPEGMQAWLLGYVRKECFAQPVPVRVFPALPSDGEQGIPGIVTGLAESPGDRVLLNLEMKSPAPYPAFGMWDFPPIEVRDDMAHMRAIDDIVGCAVILMTLEQLAEKQASCRCFGVFTRAEEGGFFGAIPLAREKALPVDTVVVSLETSKELPGAEMGGGPVIRVGDRMTTFDRKAEMVLQAAARAMTEENPDVKVQRQLMSGGTCEATVFAIEGYCTTAVAIPLGNYHNMTADLTLAPEYVNMNDVAGAVELLVRSTEFASVDNTDAARKRIYDRAEPQIERLKETFGEWLMVDG